MTYGGAHHIRRSVKVLPRQTTKKIGVQASTGSVGIFGNRIITNIPVEPGDFPTDQQLRDYGFVLAKDYGVDSSNANNATQLQAWADGAKDADKLGYLHYSDDPYLTSNRIAIIHRHSYKGGGGVPFEHWGFIGGRNPANPTDRTDRPVIKLIDNSAGYGDINDPKPLIMFTSVEPDGTYPDPDRNNWPLYVTPDNPIDTPQYWSHANGNAYGMYLEGVDLDLGSNNPGAGGLLMPGAQNCACSDIHVEATGARYGFMSVNGTNFPSQNLSCNGAYIGYQNDWPSVANGSGENAVNLKLTNCTVPINHVKTACATCITGLEISGSTVAYNAGFEADNTPESLNITDARIELTGGGTAFPNPDGASLRLVNVYISGTDNITKFGSEATVTATGTWKRVQYYVGQNQTKNNGSSGYANSTTVSFVDGATPDESAEPVVSVFNNQADPTDSIRTRHGLPIHRVDDGVDYLNVLDFGAVADGNSAGGGTDNRAAIQAAIDAAETAGHNRVFIPRGLFPVGKSPSGNYGLMLKAQTKLFGIWNARITFNGFNGIGSMIYQHDSWLPTSPSPIIETPNTTDGDWSICNLEVMTRQRTNGVTSRDTPPTYEWATCLRARSKGSSWGLHSGIAPYIDWNSFLGIPAGDSSQPISNPRNMWHFTDNAEGQHYCFGLNNPPGWNHPDFRGLKVEGTSNPLVFYGQNFEIAKEASNEWREVRWKCEFVNASNVLLINHKHEGRAGAGRWENCTNCAYIGDGAHLKDNFDWINMMSVNGACSDIWIGGSQHRRVIIGYDNPRLLVANVTGETAIDWPYTPYDLGVYKLGEFSVDRFFTFDVFPIIPGGVFDGPAGDAITNQNATWQVTNENALGGSFTYGNGGVWRYSRGGSTRYSLFHMESQ